MDYYNTRKFVCEITGNSCLTYFQAIESESKEIKLLEENFPEHLKEPILRHIQFSTVPRLDQLIDHVYTTFKNDYYPGERVMLKQTDLKNEVKVKCVIREKTKFNSVVKDGVTHPAYSKYRVSQEDAPSTAWIVDGEQISRERNHFTKWYVKTFVKLSVTRSSKIGAPWIVKNQYAERYRIPTEIPPEFAQFNEEPKPIKKKAIAIRPKTEPKVKSKAAVGSKKTTPAKKGSNGTKKKTPLQPVLPKKESTPPPPPPPRPVIKEDLSFPLDLTRRRTQPHEALDLGHSTQKALEVWAFLNIYRIPLVLDTFTFDDFTTALKWKSTTERCYLLDEIFCSLLSVFIDENSNETEVRIPEEFLSSEREQSDNEDFFFNIDNSSNSNGSKYVKKEEIGAGEEGKDIVRKDGDVLDDSEEVDFETSNKVDDYLVYRNVSWIDRLKKRTFKDGSWQIILLGILDEVRNHSEFKKEIFHIFNILAPEDSNVSPNAIQTNFFKNLTIDLRISSLSILTSILVNSNLIRQFIEKCMDESAQLRRERLEILRDYKQAYEKAQDIDKECRILMNRPQQNDEKTEENNEELTVKKRRRSDFKMEPSKEELEFSRLRPEFGVLLASRSAQLKVAEEFRAKRRAVEKKLNELDVQRVRYLGQDRLFNRYWWFENNGLPNISGRRSNGDEEDEDDEDDDDDDDDVEDDELLDETYLMGKLWIQGPSDEDLINNFHVSNKIIQKWKQFQPSSERNTNNENSKPKVEENGKIKENQDTDKEEKYDDDDDDYDDDDEGNLSEKEDFDNIDNDSSNELIKFSLIVPTSSNFTEKAKAIFNLEFTESKAIKDITNNSFLVDNNGAAGIELTNIQRKLIEEHSEVLLSKDDWRYYDTATEIEDLIKWLNEWGTRESKLLESLKNIKDQLVSSIQARRKALKLSGDSQEETELKRVIEETVISDTEVESESDSEDSSNTRSADEQDIGPEKLSVEREDQRRTRRSIAEAEKVASVRLAREAAIKEKQSERQSKLERSKPSLRIARREQRKRKFKEHEEKREIIKKSKIQLATFKIDNEVFRCRGWINQSALEKFDHSHYDGPKKVKFERQKRSSRR
ncbi:hypothetical protein WICMUC_005920 [Wickerhamomyces mucosus]|uniref:WAC domain-containing protein n=1 Tax=Wickerhamomyces mucosus TaxID=1378264 RepID=A0A9P8T2B5_9ASCO|nr:hypothetical protein WICMUC_005920 [Wickerhamomyces mucosus]